MAINAYTGLQGHGKSYEVVENVILPALMAGRRVVTNVANLDIEAITAYLVKYGLDPAKVGTVVQVQNEDIPKPNFYPVEIVAGSTTPHPESVVKGGDLVVLDEVWRWYAVGLKMDPAHMVFFRMHRHFMNPVTNVTCDVVLVVQDIGDLLGALKRVVENTFLMTKLKALGTDKRYRVDIFKRAIMRKPYRSLQRSYNKEIFALYRSYSQGGGDSGKEVAIDGRNNIFRGALFRVVLPVVLVVGAFGFWMVWKFFHPVAPAKPAAAATAPGVRPVAGVPPAPGARPPGATTGESDWRVVGDYSYSGNHYVVITRGRSVRTLFNPRGFYFDGLRAYGTLDGNQLTNYTGQAEPVSIIPGGLK